MKKIYWLLCFACIPTTGINQSMQAIRSAYEQAGKQVIVLVNKDSILPIRSLVGLNPILISDEKPATLSKALNHYITCPNYPFRVLENRSWPENTGLCIMDIDLVHTPGRELAKLSAISDHIEIPYIVVYHQGSVGCLPPNLFRNARAILFAWGFSESVPDHIAQIIFGAEGAQGYLPFFVNKEYKTGAGMMTSSLQRLKYGPPEVAGIESISFNSALQYEVEEAIRNKVFPGANLLVAKDGVVVYHQAFGKLTYDGLNHVQQADLYDLASITKILGATLGSMVLNSQSRFDPSKTVSTYLPSFKRSNKSTLVWRDILAHRSRLPATITYYRKVLDTKGGYLPRTLRQEASCRYSVQVADHLYANKKIPDKLLKDIKRIPLLSKSDYVYSDLSMILLYKTIEQITRQPFDQFLFQNIYQPIGADHTRFHPLKEFTKDQVIPTEQDSVFRHALVQGYVHDENAALLGGVSGHAGLFSNANDMAIIAQMLLNKGSYGGHHYLNPETVDLYTSYQNPELNNRRGLGFDKPLLTYDINSSAVARDASPLSYGHSGFTGTFIWIDPKYNLTYILLTNRVNPTRKNNKISEYSIRPCIQQTIYDHFLIKN